MDRAVVVAKLAASASGQKSLERKRPRDVSTPSTAERSALNARWQQATGCVSSRSSLTRIGDLVERARYYYRASVVVGELGGLVCLPRVEGRTWMGVAVWPLETFGAFVRNVRTSGPLPVAARERRFAAASSEMSGVELPARSYESVLRVSYRS